MPKIQDRGGRIADRRSRHDLDVYLLALIREGVGTIYKFQRDARLSPGATTPALKRLVSRGFIVAPPGGTRERMEYKITRQGTRYLHKEWKNLLLSTPKDMDAVVRILGTAILLHATSFQIASFLERVLTDRKTREKPFDVEPTKERTPVQKAAGPKKQLESMRRYGDQTLLERWFDSVSKKVRTKR